MEGLTHFMERGVVLLLVWRRLTILGAFCRTTSDVLACRRGIHEVQRIQRMRDPFVAQIGQLAVTGRSRGRGLSSLPAICSLLFARWWV